MSGLLESVRWEAVGGSPREPDVLRDRLFSTARQFCFLQQSCGLGKHAVGAFNVAVDHVEHSLGRAVQDDLVLKDGHPKHLAAEVVARHVEMEVDRRVVDGKMLDQVEQDLDFGHRRRRHTAADQAVNVFCQLSVRLTHRLGDHFDNKDGREHQPQRGSDVDGDRPAGGRAGAGR